MRGLNPLEDIVRQEIRRRGRVTFAEYMDWALYHPHHGYYTRGPLRTGRGGDFFTSAQTGSVFGELLTESFLEMWDLLGSGRFTLVELGGGDGAMAEQVLRTLGTKGRLDGISYHLVERSGSSREAARRRLSRFPRVRVWDDVASFEHTAGVEGCVFSNEFFDALPFHRVSWEGGRLREMFVTERDGHLIEAPGDLSTSKLARVLEEQNVRLSEGQRAEVCLAMEGAVAEIERILARGFALTIDYGEGSADLYHESRGNGARQIYRKHRIEEDPFEHIGESDITALVDFGRLAELGGRGELKPLLFADQGPYLLHSAEKRLKELVEDESRRNPSILSQVQHLLHPRGLGSVFRVLVQGKNVGNPELAATKANRLHRILPVRVA